MMEVLSPAKSGEYPAEPGEGAGGSVAGQVRSGLSLDDVLLRSLEAWQAGIPERSTEPASASTRHGVQLERSF